MLWNYVLKSGTALRNTIRNNDESLHSLYDVLSQLEKCYSELLDNGIIDSDDFERYCEEEISEGLKTEIEIEINHADVDSPEYSDVYGTYEDEVDCLLDQFYDLCDNIGIWVGF